MDNLVERHYWRAVTFLVLLILAGSGFWGLRRFNPGLFLGKPELIATPPEAERHRTQKTAPTQEHRAREPAPKATEKRSQSQHLNINTATAAELETLPKIGPRIAQRIVQYREQHGNFATVNSLQNVRGISKKTLEKLRPFIGVE